MSYREANTCQQQPGAELSCLPLQLQPFAPGSQEDVSICIKKSLYATQLQTTRFCEAASVNGYVPELADAGQVQDTSHFSKMYASFSAFVGS